MFGLFDGEKYREFKRFKEAHKKQIEDGIDELKPIMLEFESKLQDNLRETVDQCMKKELNPRAFALMMVFTFAESAHMTRKMIEKMITKESVEKLDLAVINIIRTGKPEL